MSTITTNQLNSIIESHPEFKHFRKYFGMNQEDKNDYEVGCIQTANALMPLIAELLTQSGYISNPS